MKLQHIGIIGLGKMGLNLGLNLLDHGYQVVATDKDDEQTKKFSELGGLSVPSMEKLLEMLPAPRIVWVMVPAGEVTGIVIEELAERLDEGDIVIDGGNSHFKHSQQRAKQLAEKNIHFFDAGTSGGIEGARNGVCMMIGGDETQFKTIEPIIHDISVDNGYLYAGPSGSGHFLKMVHNGIEYGMMQAIAEGFEILYKSEFSYQLRDVAKVWNNGSVIRSWLMELAEKSFAKDERLEAIKGVMHSSGEGKWTVETALDLQMATPVIALSLMMRYRSLEEDTFAGKVVAALRNEFGGHAVESK